MNDLPDDHDLFEPLDAPQPFWTWRRILFTILVLIMVIALLAYSFSGLFLPPPPSTPAPGSLI